MTKKKEYAILFLENCGYCLAYRHGVTYNKKSAIVIFLTITWARKSAAAAVEIILK
jgi:hypothetical protein